MPLKSARLAVKWIQYVGGWKMLGLRGWWWLRILTLRGISSLTASLNTLVAEGAAHPATTAASKTAGPKPTRRRPGGPHPLVAVDEIKVTTWRSVDIPREVDLNEYTKSRRSIRNLQ